MIPVPSSATRCRTIHSIIGNGVLSSLNIIIYIYIYIYQIVYKTLYKVFFAIPLVDMIAFLSSEGHLFSRTHSPFERHGSLRETQPHV